jgi:hypothetical protein
VSNGSLGAMSYNFQTQVGDNRQKEATQLVKKYWQELGYEIQDVSENSDYFSRGVDLIRTLLENEPLNIDVKCDFQTDLTGNIAFELIEIAPEDKTRSPKLGWAYGEFADEIDYVIWNAGVMFRLPLQELKQLVFASSFKGYASHHDKPFFYYTLGILVPVSSLDKFEKVSLVLR